MCVGLLPSYWASLPKSRTPSPPLACVMYGQVILLHLGTLLPSSCLMFLLFWLLYLCFFRFHLGSYTIQSIVAGSTHLFSTKAHLSEVGCIGSPFPLRLLSLSQMVPCHASFCPFSLLALVSASNSALGWLLKVVLSDEDKFWWGRFLIPFSTVFLHLPDTDHFLN